MSLDPDPQTPQPGFSSHIPESFTFLEEAQNSLYYQKNICLHAAFELASLSASTSVAAKPADAMYVESFEKNCKLYQDTFGRWCSAFQNFLDRYSGIMDAKCLQGAAVLKINQIITTLAIRSYKNAGPSNSNSWDQYRVECEEVVNLAATVVQMQHAASIATSSTKAPIFSLDVNIVAPLFNIVHRCRDPVIRRRAIVLLYSAPRQEGLWHSVVTARVCEKIMLVEEAGLTDVKSYDDIPDANRINEVDVRFDMQGRKGYLTMNRRMHSGQQFEIFEPVTHVSQEIIEW